MSLKQDKQDYIEHIKLNILAAINEVSEGEVISSAFHDEFSYNDDVDLNVTIKVLPGQIQSGVVQYPGELMIEVNDLYYPIVDEALNKFAVDLDEDIVTLGGKDYREFYSLPNVIGTFQNNGIVNKTAISLSFSLISFNNVMGLKTDPIVLEEGQINDKGCLKLAVEDGASSVLKWLNYAISFASDTNSTGGIGAPQTSQIGETTANNYTFTFVPKNNITAHQYLWNQIITGSNSNRKYRLTIPSYDPTAQNPNEAEITIDCVMYAGSITGQSNGLPIMQVTFVRGDFDA